MDKPNSISTINAYTYIYIHIILYYKYNYNYNYTYYIILYICIHGLCLAMQGKRPRVAIYFSIAGFGFVTSLSGAIEGSVERLH